MINVLSNETTEKIKNTKTIEEFIVIINNENDKIFKDMHTYKAFEVISYLEQFFNILSDAKKENLIPWDDFPILKLGNSFNLSMRNENREKICHAIVDHSYEYLNEVVAKNFRDIAIITVTEYYKLLKENVSNPLMDEPNITQILSKRKPEVKKNII